MGAPRPSTLRQIFPILRHAAWRSRRWLEDAMTVRRGEAKGQTQAKLSPETRENLLRIGRERALVYKTLVLTGLRKCELASITVGQVDLGGRVPHLLLHARDEKNRRGSEIPTSPPASPELAESAEFVNEKPPVSSCDIGGRQSGRGGSNSRHSAWEWPGCRSESP